MELSEDGLRAARRYAEWNLGDPSWANSILWAYQNPEETIRMIEEEN